MLLTCLGLVGFATYPLMPPRLVTMCGYKYGACDKNFTFVDTLEEYGGLLNWKSKRMSERSNMYAAMPSLHFGWSLWCFYSLLPLCPNTFFKCLAFVHPAMTLFVIVVTGNHYILDAIFGALTYYAASYLLPKVESYLEFGRGSIGKDKKTNIIAAIIIIVVIGEYIF